MVTVYKFQTYVLNLYEDTNARHGGQVARRWSCKPKIMGSIPIHAFQDCSDYIHELHLVS